MKGLAPVLLLALAMSLPACSGDKKAAELLETAQFEEKQNNKEHAVALYDEIIRVYPGSPSAASAAKRIEFLKNKGK